MYFYLLLVVVKHLVILMWKDATWIHFIYFKKKKKLKLTIVPGENTKTDCTKNAKSQHTKSYHVAAAMHDVNECVICAEHCFYQPEMLAMSSKFCNLFSVKITTLWYIYTCIIFFFLLLLLFVTKMSQNGSSVVKTIKYSSSAL